MASTSPPWGHPTPYERWYASSLGQAYAASLGRFLRPWLAGTGGLLALDIGCGPGLEIERFFPPEARLVGLDCSLDMARRGAERCRQAGRPRPFVVGSATRLPFAGGCFDVAFAVNCLEFVGDREAAFAEIARVLRPSGRAILGVLNRASVWEWTRRLWRPFRRTAYYRGRFYTAREVEDLCARVGLVVEELRSVVHFPPIPPGPWRGLYERLDLRAVGRQSGRGGVLLCRAVKASAGGNARRRSTAVE